MLVEDLKTFIEEVNKHISDENVKSILLTLVGIHKDKSYDEIVEIIRTDEDLEDRPEIQVLFGNKAIEDGIKIKLLEMVGSPVRRKEATEFLVKLILSKSKIYTIRSDNKAEMWIFEKGIYSPNGKSFIKEYCRNLLGEAFTSHLVNEVIAKIEADTFIEARDFFEREPKWKICLENGVLDLETFELSSWDDSLFFFSKIPVSYNPEATCPAIIKHFEEVLENKDDIHLIQELFGFLLPNEYFLEKFFVFLGGGRNGKSKSLELVKLFLGVDNCCSVSPQNLETNDFSLALLHRRKANLVPDMDARSIKYSGLLKASVGRDMLTSNRKFLDHISFVNHAKHLFACNQLPKTYDKSVAFFNRAMLLNFPYTFVSEVELKQMKDEDKVKYKVADPEIINKLSNSDELSGLLNWSIDGLKRCKKAKSFSYSKTTEQTQEMWLRKSDSFTSFMQDCIELDYDKSVAKGEFQEMYRAYCKHYKVKAENLMYQKKILTEEYGIWDERSGSDPQRMWKGIKIKEVKTGQTGQSPFLYLYCNLKYGYRGKYPDLPALPDCDTQKTLKDATEIHNDVYLDEYDSDFVTENNDKEEDLDGI